MMCAVPMKRLPIMLKASYSSEEPRSSVRKAQPRDDRGDVKYTKHVISING